MKITGFNLRSIFTAQYYSENISIYLLYVVKNEWFYWDTLSETKLGDMFWLEIRTQKGDKMLQLNDTQPSNSTATLPMISKNLLT